MAFILDNPILRQIESIPELLLEQYEKMEPLCRTILDTPTIFSIKKIILTGSGDSYAAALATKPLFEKLLAIPVEVADPLALSREYPMKWVGESPCDPLVIAMSNSGRAARVVEAVQRLRANNALTLAITSDENSPLGKAAEKILPLSFKPFESSPGARTYAVMLLCCQLLAIRFGEVRLKYSMDDANRMRHEMIAQANILQRCLPAWADTAGKAAEFWKDALSLEAVGSAYQKGSAFYTHAKSYEAAGLAANYTDSENWFHLNYFLRNIRQTATVVFAGRENPANSRNRELIERMKEMGRAFALITDQEDLQAAYLFLLPPIEFGYLWPLIEWAAAALVVSGITQLTGETYSRGFEGIWEEKDGAYSPTESQLILQE